MDVSGGGGVNRRSSRFAFRRVEGTEGEHIDVELRKM
jgi:hypothetical protein